MKIRLGSLLLALVCLLYVAGIPGATLRPLALEPTAPPLPQELEGRDGALDVVVRAAADDGAAGEPLKGARVRAFAMIDRQAYAAGEAITDGDGVASLARLPHAEHWIVADAPGFARASQMVVVVAGPRRVDLTLGPEHRLDVTVKADEGAPIAGAELEVRGLAPFPVGARTDAEGRAHVEGLGEGPFTVTARAPGFEPVTRRRVQEGEPCAITLGRQSALLVTVVGAHGEKVHHARVSVASPSLWPARMAETGPDGTVRIGGLDAGSYALRATEGSRVSVTDEGVEVGRGDERVVTLALHEGRMVAVRAVDAESGDGVDKARVVLTEGGLSSFPLEGVTDRRGAVVLGPIARGAQDPTLSARADGWVPKGAVRVSSEEPETRIPLLRGGVLGGRVVDVRGFPVDGATIRVVGTDLEGMPIDEEPRRGAFREAHFTATLAGPTPLVPAGDLGVVPGPIPGIPRAFGGPSLLAGKAGEAEVEPWVSARDGTFHATPIPPGRVRALVRHPQYVEAMSEVVTLAARGEAEVRVVLARGGTLEGRVLDARRRPLAGARVTALATAGSLERIAVTGSDGSFGFAAMPATVTLLVSRDDEGSAVVARRTVDVPDGGKATAEFVLPEPREPVAVKVVDERGRPVATAQVSASSLDVTEALRTTVFTDARGEAELPSSRGLPLRLEVSAPSFATRVMPAVADVREVTVELAHAERLTGEVRENRRAAAAFAEVSVRTESGIRRGVTDKDGVFVVGDLPAGPAELRVRAKGRAPHTANVRIEKHAGQRPTSIGVVELPEEGIVEGTVVDAKGNPVAGARVGKDAVQTFVPATSSGQGALASTGSRGAFRLSELAEGETVIEAYAPDLGRGRTSVRVLSGRTVSGITIVLTSDGPATAEAMATGGVAVTLGETAAGLERAEVVVVAVAEGSEAERAGIFANDTVLEVGGVPVTTIAEARARLSGPVHDDVLVKVRRASRTLSLRVPREPVRR